jgi:hypothetical protein
MLKRFFVFLMAFSLLSANLAHAMSDEERDGENFSYTTSSKAPPPLERDEGLDFQDKAFISVTFASLIAALLFVYKFKPS